MHGNNIWILAFMRLVHHQSMSPHVELMLSHKHVLPIEINMEESDLTVTFMDFHERADFTFSQVERKTAKTLKLLEETKPNIVDAQKLQKEQYDRKHSQQG